MDKETMGFIREYLAIKALLKTVEKDGISGLDIDLDIYRERLQAVETLLAYIKESTGDRRFEVFYLHYVKGMSLQKVADKVGYSKAGVIKICRQLRMKK